MMYWKEEDNNQDGDIGKEEKSLELTKIKLRLERQIEFVSVVDGELTALFVENRKRMGVENYREPDENTLHLDMVYMASQECGRDYYQKRGTLNMYKTVADNIPW